MVEIGLEPVDDSAMPKDLYLSLRIGETQKFAKASTTRAYKFSDAAIDNRKNAKLEIYKRVGIANLSIDSQKFQGTHEIAVKVQDPRIEGEQVRYHVNLASAPGLKDKEVKSGGKDKPEGLNLKVQAAKEYLERHQLEQRLSEAMQAVLRERPEDPGKFVAERLLSCAGMLKKVDPPPAIPAVEPPTPAPPSLPLPPAEPEVQIGGKDKPEGVILKDLPGDPMVSPIMPMSVMVCGDMVTFANMGMGPVMIF